MRIAQHMFAFVGVTLVLIGCTDANPGIEYEPPIRLDDLAPGLPRSENDYVLLTDEATTGRFAATLAVARFVPQDGANGLEMVLETPAPAEQALWTETLRGVAQVRDLVFVSPTAVKPRGDDMQSLCETARALRARLLLVYARNGLGPNSAQVLGVLYDAATCEALGTIHASACYVNDEGVEVAVIAEPGDLRNVDARFQSQRTFEELALDCLRELIKRDTRIPGTEPHIWGKPIEERWWVPYPRH